MTSYDSVTDSGERRDFGTGSVRDQAEGKGRYDLLEPYAIRRLAQHFENGAKKYGDNNWKLGQPLSVYLDSGIRHGFNLLEGKTDEDHAAAMAWNAMAFISTKRWVDEGTLPAELDDIAWDPQPAEADPAEASRVFIAPIMPKVGDVLAGGKEGLRHLPIGTVINWEGRRTAVKVSKKKWLDDAESEPERDRHFAPGWVIESLSEPEPLTQAWEQVGWTTENGFDSIHLSSAQASDLSSEIGPVKRGSVTTWPNEWSTVIQMNTEHVEAMKDFIDSMFDLRAPSFEDAVGTPGNLKLTKDDLRREALDFYLEVNLDAYDGADLTQDDADEILREQHPEHWAIVKDSRDNASEDFRRAVNRHYKRMLRRRRQQRSVPTSGDRVSVREVSRALDGTTFLFQGGPANGVAGVRLDHDDDVTPIVAILDALEEAGLQVTKA